MTDSNLNIAIFQYNLLWENINLNLNETEHLLDKIPVDTDLVVLPETFTTGFTNNNKAFAAHIEDTTFNRLKQMAVNRGIAICGSLITEVDGHIFNRFIFIEPEGTIHHYDKRHLFTMSEEDKYFSAGRQRVVITYKGWRIMPQICYDLRFPVWSRNNNDYDVLIYVANWPGVRQHVWHTLLRARAIENQCYVIGANRTGNDGNGIYYLGGSAIIDARGDIIARGGDNPVILKGLLEMNKLIEFRKKFPVLTDRDRFELK